MAAPANDQETPQPTQEPLPHQQQSPRSSLFAIPSPIRRLFNRFPLQTYPPNELPIRCATTRAEENVPVLYIFSDWEDAREGRPSFHPACLKWQTYLKMSNIEFVLHPSTNHASPSGSLPYLQPSPSSAPISGSKLRTHLAGLPTATPAPASPPQAAPYASLIDHPIRRAYLHAVYLSLPNSTVLADLYLSSTNSSIVRAVLLRTLRSAAEDEILSSGGGYTPTINVEGLYTDAKEALEALDSLLKDKDWFWGAPGEFDAAVFAYTDILLRERLGWKDTRLGDMVRSCDNLVSHRRRVMERYWPEMGKVSGVDQGF